MLAAAEAAQLGYGGVSLVSRACGLSRSPLSRALGEPGRAAVAGGTRPRAGADVGVGGTRSQATGRVGRFGVSPLARGGPVRRCAGHCKSTRTLAGELTDAQHRSAMRKCPTAAGMNYSLQSKPQDRGGSSDRDAQFSIITRKCGWH